MNDLLKPLVSVLTSPIGGSKCATELLEKLSLTLHADLLCLSKTDREEILNQVGIPLDTLANGFQINSYSNLWSVEQLIINKLKRTDLIGRLWAGRQKFHTQVGDDIYKKYTSSLAVGLTEEKIKALVANDFSEQAQATTGDFKDIDCIKLEAAIRGDVIVIALQISAPQFHRPAGEGRVREQKTEI